MQESDCRWQAVGSVAEYSHAVLDDEVLLYHRLSRDTWLIDLTAFSLITHLWQQASSLADCLSALNQHRGEERLESQQLIAYLEHLQKSGLVSRYVAD
ncbi:hypothetical protein [Motiliproteus sediminis]|uniref:hypothetical protein n=1 Tax=Motiliproteus sediminis TaxID=1468178 RepID=UPI001AEFF262|nr:hypothetical protein [Motiliproteus sediminis]